MCVDLLIRRRQTHGPLKRNNARAGAIYVYTPHKPSSMSNPPTRGGWKVAAPKSNPFSRKALFIMRLLRTGGTIFITIIIISWGQRVASSAAAAAAAVAERHRSPGQPPQQPHPLIPDLITRRNPRRNMPAINNSAPLRLCARSVCVCARMRPKCLLSLVHLCKSSGDCLMRCMNVYIWTHSSTTMCCCALLVAARRRISDLSHLQKNALFGCSCNPPGNALSVLPLLKFPL